MSGEKEICLRKSLDYILNRLRCFHVGSQFTAEIYLLLLRGNRAPDEKMHYLLIVIVVEELVNRLVTILHITNFAIASERLILDTGFSCTM